MRWPAADAAPRSLPAARATAHPHAVRYYLQVSDDSMRIVSFAGGGDWLRGWRPCQAATKANAGDNDDRQQANSDARDLSTLPNEAHLRSFAM